jgi:hypothetical protein
MHLHYIEAWILEESPRFATAFADYYENNGRNIALFATTHMQDWRMAETSKNAHPDFFWLRQQYRARIGQAVATGDSEYFDKCARALDYLADKAAGKTSKSDYLTPERYTIDAYHWLRVVAGRGSARPTSEQLRQEAKWVWAYAKVCPSDRAKLIVRNGQVSSSRLGYQAFKDKVRNDWKFRECVEIELANPERLLFSRNHFDRILKRIGLYDDLKGKRGRPRASARQVALVKEKKFPKITRQKGKYS